MCFIELRPGFPGFSVRAVMALDRLKVILLCLLGLALCLQARPGMAGNLPQPRQAAVLYSLDEGLAGTDGLGQGIGNGVQDSGRYAWQGLAGLALLGAIILLQLVNIAYRKRSEAVSRRAKQRYQNIFDNSAVALVEADCRPIREALQQSAHVSGGPLTLPQDVIRRTTARIKVTDANPAALALFGAPDKSRLIIAMEQFLGPGFDDCVLEIAAALASGRRRVSREIGGRTQTGLPLDLILSLTLPHDPRYCENLIISLVDITDRKRSEEALRRSEAHFRTVFEHAASGMALVDLEGNYLRVNAALCRMLDYAESRLLELNWREVTHPDDATEAANAAARLLKGERSVQIECRFLNSLGQTVWTLLNSALIHDERGEPLYYCFQAQDITPMKLAQARLREREERYRQIFEADLSGFYVVKPGGRLTLCNQAFAAMLGFSSPDELIGADFGPFYKDPELRPQLLAELSRTKALLRREVELVRRDGTPVHVLFNTKGIFDADGRLVEVRGFLMDMTREKSLEAQLLHAQKMESIGTMAGGVAHDFNNLLMGIMGNNSLLMMDLGEDHPCFGRLRQIEQFVQSGSELTRQLLGFAKGGKYEVKPTDLNRLIERNINLFARTYKNIRVRLALSPDLLLVEADRSQIDQVLYNLYVNAGQAMESGGDLNIATANRVLNADDAALDGVAPGNYVEIRVSDTGIGMDEATMQRIFDPFFTTKERGRGTGLGLASAYGIVKNHGGFISVSSRVREGSTFTICLPAAGAGEEQEIVQDDTTDPGGGNENILLVDDEEIIIEAVGNMLRRLGYSVCAALSGPEAVQVLAARKNEIDLVLLDMVMPGMSGADTFEQLKLIKPDVRVILCSGYSSDGQAAEILHRGCQGFMQKPFSYKELSQKLDEVLNHR